MSDKRKVSYLSAQRLRSGLGMFGWRVGYDRGDLIPFVNLVLGKWTISIGPHYKPKEGPSQVRIKVTKGNEQEFLALLKRCCPDEAMWDGFLFQYERQDTWEGKEDLVKAWYNIEGIEWGEET